MWLWNKVFILVSFTDGVMLEKQKEGGKLVPVHVSVDDTLSLSSKA